MVRLSLKNIIIVVLIIVLLAHCGRVFRICAGMYVWVYDSLEPFRSAPPVGRYVLVVAVLLLIYVTVFKLFHKRK